MHQHSLTHLSHAVRLCLATGLFVAAGTVTVKATSGDEAMALCEADLKDNYGATSVYDIGVRRHNELPFAYGDADFSDATKVHFRCKVFQGKVDAIHFLVQHPMEDGARLWSTERPHGDEHVDMPLDDKAMAPPQVIEGSPKFERVPD